MSRSWVKWGLILAMLLAVFCAKQRSYLQQWRDVGRIDFDANQDKSDFILGPVDEIQQYYSVGTAYEGGVTALKTRLLRPLNTLPNSSTHYGYVTIRFIVNKKGETDRYRIQQLDTLYQSTYFPQILIDSLLQRTRKLKSWLPGKLDSHFCDSYYYITFKIRKENPVDITP